MHRHQEARVEAEFGEATGRQRAVLPRGEILPHPQQRPPRREATGKPGDEAGRRRAMAAVFGEHLVQRAAHQPALQRRVGAGMAERHPRQPVGGAFETADGSAQGRKRAHARAAHAPLPVVVAIILLERMTSPFVHDMF